MSFVVTRTAIESAITEHKTQSLAYRAEQAGLRWPDHDAGYALDFIGEALDTAYERWQLAAAQVPAGETEHIDIDGSVFDDVAHSHLSTDDIWQTYVELSAYAFDSDLDPDECQCDPMTGSKAEPRSMTDRATTVLADIWDTIYRQACEAIGEAAESATLDMVDENDEISA